MVEGFYNYGALYGWCRTIHSDGYYTISWCEDGRDIGYCKMLDNTFTVNFEGYYYKLDHYIWGKDVKHDEKILSKEQKKEYYK